MVFDIVDFKSLDNIQILDVFRKDCDAIVGDTMSELIIKFHNVRLIKKNRLTRWRRIKNISTFFKIKLQ